MTSKLYLLIPDGVPVGFAINGAAHAGTAAALKWGVDDPVFRDWAYNSFRKVTCRASVDEIQSCEHAIVTQEWGGVSFSLVERARVLEEHRIIITEDALDGRVVAVIFKPREEWPESFRKLPLYG